jgi:hypothetical protein
MLSEHSNFLTVKNELEMLGIHEWDMTLLINAQLVITGQKSATKCYALLMCLLSQDSCEAVTNSYLSFLLST